MARVKAARWQALAVIPSALTGTSAASRVTVFRREHLIVVTLAERRDCPYCPARAGELCRTASGALAFYHHARLWGAD